MTPELLAFLRAFIEARRWQFAKTYAKSAPHDYTIRGWLPEPADQADFERFVRAVRAHGYDRPFRRRTYRTLDVDEHIFWTMGAEVGATTVINRATLNGAKPRASLNERRVNHEDVQDDVPRPGDGQDPEGRGLGHRVQGPLGDRAAAGGPREQGRGAGDRPARRAARLVPGGGPAA